MPKSWTCDRKILLRSSVVVLVLLLSAGLAFVYYPVLLDERILVPLLVVYPFLVWWLGRKSFVKGMLLLVAVIGVWFISSHLVLVSNLYVEPGTDIPHEQWEPTGFGPGFDAFAYASYMALVVSGMKGLDHFFRWIESG